MDASAREAIEAEAREPNGDEMAHRGDEPIAYGWQADNDDFNKPGERISVYNSAGGWVGAKGDSMLTIHGVASEAALPRGEIVLTTGALQNEAAALAFMKSQRTRYDIRPALLLMFHSEDHTELPAILCYGAAYLAVWCGRNELLSNTAQSKRAEMVQWAAADGLALLYCAREKRRSDRLTARLTRLPSDTRAALLGVKEATYALLRKKAAAVYSMRLDEARAAFRVTIEGASGNGRRSGSDTHWQHEDRGWNPANARATKDANAARETAAMWRIQHPLIPTLIDDRSGRKAA